MGKYATHAWDLRIFRENYSKQSIFSCFQWKIDQNTLFQVLFSLFYGLFARFQGKSMILRGLFSKIHDFKKPAFSAIFHDFCVFNQSAFQLNKGPFGYLAAFQPKINTTGPHITRQIARLFFYIQVHKTPLFCGKSFLGGEIIIRILNARLFISFSCQRTVHQHIRPQITCNKNAWAANHLQ